MGAVSRSLLLAIRQLGDPAILRVLAKSAGLTLLIFAILGPGAWFGLDWLISWIGLADASVYGWGESLRRFAALVLTLLMGWLLWRIIALAIIQFFADDVVIAVESRHYPEAAANRRNLPFREEVSVGAKSAMRAFFANLVALPVALLLLVTGVGTAVLFWLVNALLLGRELDEMVWIRHRRDTSDISPASRSERFLLGGAIAGLMLVPFINLLAPVLGAAAAAHLIHQKGNN